jgi:hypothetical protein
MVNNTLGRIWNEAVMSTFKILSLNLSEGTEETTTNSLGAPCVQSVCGLKLEPGMSVTQSKRFAIGSTQEA